MTRLMENILDLYNEGGKIFSKLTEIKDIPTTITNNHNESFYYWQCLERATMLRIDAHPDMLDWIPSNSKKNYFKELGIANFNCAGIHSNYIYEIFWLNPHSKKRRLQDMGCNPSYVSFCNLFRRKLKTSYTLSNTIVWYFLGIESLKHGKGKILNPNKQIPINGKYFLVDIDLDGFCCNKYIYFKEENWQSVLKFRERINESFNYIKNLRKPDLITITRSFGESESKRFIPKDKVKVVEDYVFKRLKQIY
ncbi:MAG: hypothetical protein ACOYT4_02350 [Nanoarchaeota archaeon]